MTYVTEKDGKYYVKNKTLYWTGRILASLPIIWVIISHVPRIFNDISEFPIFEICFFLVFLAIGSCSAFLMLLIGSRISIISEEGIDTYRDMMIIRMSKKHRDPCTYTIERHRSRGRYITTTDIWLKGERRIITLITLCILDSEDEAERQIDEALSHFASFTREGLTAEYGYERCPQCNGYIHKTVGKCTKCGYQIVGVKSWNGGFPDLPILINIGKYCKGIKECFYSLKVNSTKYLKDGKVDVSLHTNGIAIEQGINYIYISFEQLIEMKCTINADPESKYRFFLCMDYYDVYKHSRQAQVIGCKKEEKDFVERCMVERNKHNLPEKSEHITCNLLDENGKFSEEKAKEALKVVKEYKLARELKRIESLQESQSEYFKELASSLKDGATEKNGCGFYLLFAGYIIFYGGIGIYAIYSIIRMIRTYL